MTPQVYQWIYRFEGLPVSAAITVWNSAGAEATTGTTDEFGALEVELPTGRYFANNAAGTKAVEPVHQYEPGTDAVVGGVSVSTTSFKDGTDSRRVDLFGADRTGVADSGAAIIAAWNAIPAAGGVLDFPEGTYRCDTPVAYTDGDSVGTALLPLFEKADVLLRGSGTGSKIYTTSAVATELVRLQNTQRLRIVNMQFRVQGTAKITHGLHLTCSRGASVHEVSITSSRVVCASAPTLCHDANGAVGTTQIVSPTAAFGSSHVGGSIAYWQSLGAGLGSITAVATLMGTLNNGGTLSAVATSIPLTAPIAGAPTGRYCVMLGSEMLQVTAGGQTSTLTVTRGWGGTTAATHADGATLSTSSATLDSPIISDFSSQQESINFTTVNQAVMQNAWSLGVDHPGASNLDLAGFDYISSSGLYALAAAFNIGNGTAANTLEINAETCTVFGCLYGVLHNGTRLQWQGAGPDHVGISHKVVQANSESLIISGNRMEGSGRLYDASGLGKEGGQVTIRGFHVQTHYALDGVSIRHKWSAPLSLENMTFANSILHPSLSLFVIQGADTSHPTPVYSKNIGVMGFSDPFTFLDPTLAMLTEFSPFYYSPTAGVGYLPSGRGARIASHLSSAGLVPSVAAGAALGTLPPAPTITTTSTDTRGTVALGTGSAPSADVLAVVTYASAYISPAVIILTPKNAATANLGIYVTASANGSFQIASATAPTADQAAGTYSVNYMGLG